MNDKMNDKRNGLTYAEVLWLKCKAEAAKIFIEKKQIFLGYIHDCKSFGEARELTGISLKAACGIINSNIKTMHFLNNAKEAK